eukprot:jgi/Mesvir1/1780/Mv26450-RA.1
MRRARARFTALKGFEPGLDILNVKEHGGVRPGYRLADLIYADDTTLIESPEHIQTWLDCLGLEARAVGLEISVKTEAMVIGASSKPPLPRLLDGTEVPFRDRFKLLGSWLPDTADDVDTRIGLAWAKLRSLTPYWRSKGLGGHRKRMLFKVLVLTVLTYGAEAWTITPTLAARLDGTVYMMLRQVLNVGFSERPSSESLYHGMPRVSDEIRQRRIALICRTPCPHQPGRHHPRSGRPPAAWPARAAHSDLAWPRGHSQTGRETCHELRSDVDGRPSGPSPV